MQPANEACSDTEEQPEACSDSDPESGFEVKEADPIAPPEGLYLAVFAKECCGKCETLFCQNYTSKWRAVRQLLEFIYTSRRLPYLSYADLVTHSPARNIPVKTATTTPTRRPSRQPWTPTCSIWQNPKHRYLLSNKCPFS
jgi:hypothetical protein